MSAAMIAGVPPAEIRNIIARARLDEPTGVLPGSPAYEVLRYFGPTHAHRLAQIEPSERWELLMDLDGRFLTSPPTWAASALLLIERNLEESCTHLAEPVLIGPPSTRSEFEISLARCDVRADGETTIGPLAVLLHSNDEYTVLEPELAEALAAALLEAASGARAEQEKADQANGRREAE